MNLYLIIILIVVLAVILFFLLKKKKPSVDTTQEGESEKSAFTEKSESGSESSEEKTE